MLKQLLEKGFERVNNDVNFRKTRVALESIPNYKIITENTDKLT